MWSSDLQQTIIQSCKTAEFRLLEPLSRHTSFRIGGPAAIMVFPKTVEELKPLLQTASAHGITPYILGAGTNVLAPDEGLQAIVICLKDALTASVFWIRQGWKFLQAKAWRKRLSLPRTTR